MIVRGLQRGAEGVVREVLEFDSAVVERAEWLWIDIEVEPDRDEGSQDATSLLALLAPLALDAFAIHDALEDSDVPKFDDFGGHLLLVLHGLRDDHVAMYEVAPNLLESLTAVRADIGAVRRSVHPQREALDDIRRSDSPLVEPVARRRLDDVFDVATRAGHDLDAARSALSETLEAYRGAEARKATEVSRVLTIYAAILLPLSLVVGFFGMNFENLPLTTRSNGWIIVSITMGVIATLSLGMFVGAGWMRRPSGRSAGRAIGKGLIEAALAPVELVGSVIEVSGEAASSATGRLFRRRHRLGQGLPEAMADGEASDGDR